MPGTAPSCQPGRTSNSTKSSAAPDPDLVQQTGLLHGTSDASPGSAAKSMEPQTLGAAPAHALMGTPCPSMYATPDRLHPDQAPATPPNTRPAGPCPPLVRAQTAAAARGLTVAFGLVQGPLCKGQGDGVRARCAHAAAQAPAAAHQPQLHEGRDLLGSALQQDEPLLDALPAQSSRGGQVGGGGLGEVRARDQSAGNPSSTDPGPGTASCFDPAPAQAAHQYNVAPPVFPSSSNKR